MGAHRGLDVHTHQHAHDLVRVRSSVRVRVRVRVRVKVGVRVRGRLSGGDVIRHVLRGLVNVLVAPPRVAVRTRQRRQRRAV